MPARTKARKRALDLLYEADVRDADPLTLLSERETRGDLPMSDYARSLVDGVQAHRARVDEVIATYAIDWPLDRMPAVDRNLLRVAIYELLWCPDVPGAVAINEAVELARDLSTEGSPPFINGVLARVLAEREALLAP